MNLKNKLTLLMLLLFSGVLIAQTGSVIKGTVVSATDNIPIPGVNVIIVGTSTGVSTDFDGNYEIKANKGDVLQFSYIGFSSQTVIVGAQTSINVTLSENLSELDEVVVIGYGDQKKTTVTSALTEVSGKDIQDLAVSRVEDALQGRVAGLRIQVVSSEAGGDPRITLRGPGSITGSSSPLIVVDGLVLGTEPDILASIDNNNIESISVLKDASSVAIYGSRGANGVILVTLKKGVVGKTQFSYNTFTGYRSSKINDNFNSSIADERARLDGLSDVVNAIPLDSPNYDRVINDYNTTYAELEAMEFIASLGEGEQNLQEQIFNGGFVKNHALAVRGGTELTKYSGSLGYLEDEGIALQDNFKKYNARIKIDSKSKNQKIRFGVNMRVNYNDQDRLPSRFIDPIRQYGFVPLYLNEDHLKYITQSDPGDAGLQFQNIGVGSYGFSRAFDHVFTRDPNNPRAIARDPNTGLPLVSPLTSGGLTLSTTKNVHPLAHFLERSRLKNQINLNVSSYVDFKLAKGLNFRQMVSGVYRENKTNENDFVFGQENREQESYRLQRRDELNQYAFESTLKYKKGFGKHNFNTLLGFEYTNRDFYRQESEAVGYTDDFNEG